MQASDVEICNLGEAPALGVVPRTMHAFAVRQSRFGQPKEAWQHEILPTPTIAADEVLIYVMATGINYNNVWAALGQPVDVIAERQKSRGEKEDFHAGGSDCSGIVWSVGADVTQVKPGDEVMVHSGWWEPKDPWVLSGRDPMLAESTRIWGYQTNYGSYCQFARAQAHSAFRNRKRSLGNRRDASAVRLHGLPDADGLVRQRGGEGRRRPGVGRGRRARVHGVADRAGSGRASNRVSSRMSAKRQFCLDHGAVGVINRKQFSHWGVMPETDTPAYNQWIKGARCVREGDLGHPGRTGQPAHRV